MSRYNKAMDRLSRIVLIITGTFMSAMVLIIFVQVFSRFVFNKTPRWSEEFTIVLLLYVGFLGASVAYRERLHIGIKVFLMKMGPKFRNKVYFALDGLVGAFALFMTIYGANFAWFTRNQTLPATKIPVGMTYLPIPLTGIVLFLFVVEKILTDIAERKTGATDDVLAVDADLPNIVIDNGKED